MDFILTLPDYFNKNKVITPPFTKKYLLFRRINVVLLNNKYFEINKGVMTLFLLNWSKRVGIKFKVGI